MHTCIELTSFVKKLDRRENKAIELSGTSTPTKDGRFRRKKRIESEIKASCKPPEKDPAWTVASAKGDTLRSSSVSPSNTDGIFESTPQVPGSDSAKRPLASTRMITNASAF